MHLGIKRTSRYGISLKKPNTYSSFAQGAESVKQFQCRMILTLIQILQNLIQSDSNRDTKSLWFIQTSENLIQSCLGFV